MRWKILIVNKWETIRSRLKSELNDRKALLSLLFGIFVYLLVNYLFASTEFYRIIYWSVGRSVALNAIFTFAVKNEILDRKRFSSPNLKSAVESVKRDAISIKDIEKILEVARTKYKITHYTCWSLLFLTGMRVGELRALEWETDIDFDNNLIHINKTKDRYGSRTPKTKNSYRKFPMNENIKKILLN